MKLTFETTSQLLTVTAGWGTIWHDNMIEINNTIYVEKIPKLLGLLNNSTFQATLLSL